MFSRGCIGKDIDLVPSRWQATISINDDQVHRHIYASVIRLTLRWRHNRCDSVSNHQHRECLLRRLIRRTSKKTSKLRVTGLCAGNSAETGEFPAQMASNAENVSIWWRHHEWFNTLSQLNNNTSISPIYVTFMMVFFWCVCWTMFNIHVWYITTLK